MPYIILEDKKGFKKDYGWQPRRMLDIRVAIYEPPRFKYNPDDPQYYPDYAATTSYAVFYPDRELCTDVWLYREM